MFIDLKLTGKTVMVIGGGAEAYRKTLSFLDSGATIWVISKGFSNDMLCLGDEKKAALLKTEIKDVKSFIASLKPKPDVLLAATDDKKLNLELIMAAKAHGSLVYAVDDPAASDFILPAIARIGDVKVAVSTGGESPTMARVLRKRIEKMVTSQDLLEIKLQAKMRATLKKRIPDAKERGKILFEMHNDQYIKQALYDSNLEEAEKLALKLIENKENNR